MTSIMNTSFGSMSNKSVETTFPANVKLETTFPVATDYRPPPAPVDPILHLTGVHTVTLHQQVVATPAANKTQWHIQFDAADYSRVSWAAEDSESTLSPFDQHKYSQQLYSGQGELMAVGHEKNTFKVVSKHRRMQVHNMYGQLMCTVVVDEHTRETTISLSNGRAVYRLVDHNVLTVPEDAFSQPVRHASLQTGRLNGGHSVLQIQWNREGGQCDPQLKLYILSAVLYADNVLTRKRYLYNTSPAQGPHIYNAYAP